MAGLVTARNTLESKFRIWGYVEMVSQMKGKEARWVDVALLPAEMDRINADGYLAVVIDVLRATTTIVTALANGAARVIPIATVEAARSRHAREPDLLLGGERGAHPLPGFDLGNSPREYTKERIEGKGLILTTTNGTRAMEATRRAGAKTTVIGALTNRQAVVDFCSESEDPLLFVCAGCHGGFSLEDALCAGAFIAGLEGELHLTDAAQVCLALFNHWGHDELALQIGLSEHGQRLKRKGYGEDIKLAMEIDRFSVIPVYQDGEIRLMEA